MRVNYILKTHATRYIAAAEKEWLYPERHVSTTDWRLLNDDWFLLPNLWKISFTSEIVMGGDGWAWAMDEYGRHPGDPQYKNKMQHEIDWVLHEVSKQEWAKKRVGESPAQVEELRHGSVGDALMREYLQEEGLLPDSAENEPKPEEEDTTSIPPSEPPM